MFPEIWVWLGHTQFNALVSYSSLLWWLFLHKKILETNQFLLEVLIIKKPAIQLDESNLSICLLNWRKKTFLLPYKLISHSFWPIFHLAVQFRLSKNISGSFLKVNVWLGISDLAQLNIVVLKILFPLRLSLCKISKT